MKEDTSTMMTAGEIERDMLISQIKNSTYGLYKEDNEMKATSVEVVNGVVDMDMKIESSPLDETRIVVSATTNDDSYEFNCSGPGCEAFLRKMDFVPAKEYEFVHNKLTDANEKLLDKKVLINKLEISNKKHKDKIKELETQLDILKCKYNFERSANEAQHKFLVKYAGKGTEIEYNYAIDDTDEVSYVIVDKDCYDKLKSEVGELGDLRYSLADANATNEVLVKENDWLRKNYIESQKEDKEMEPTSVFKIENIDKIWITQDGDEISLLLKNKDDLTKIILTGDAIKNHNDNFITTLKTDLDDLEQEREALLEENDKLRYAFDDEVEENKKLRKRIDTLKGKKKLASREDSTDDMVNHPSHYKTGKFESIEVMQEVFGINAVRDFCKCNAFKYIYRMDRKNGKEDVRKAIWYLNKYLELTAKED